MKLAFITSVRHPRNCHSFERVVALLHRTLRSVREQISTDHDVFVVANREAGDLGIDTSQASLIRIDVPHPADQQIATDGHGPSFLDRGTKYAIAIRQLQSRGFSHVMFFDADDFVHRGITEVVSNFCDEHSGLYSFAGLSRSEDSKRVRVRRNFHVCNGSTHVIPMIAFEDLAVIDPSDGQEMIIDQLGIDRVVKQLGDHVHTVNWVRAAGLTMRAMPIPAAIWNLGTGENWMGCHSMGGRACESKRIGRTFGYEAESHGLRSILGDLHYAAASLLARRRHREDVHRYGAAKAPA